MQSTQVRVNDYMLGPDSYGYDTFGHETLEKLFELWTKCHDNGLETSELEQVVKVYRAKLTCSPPWRNVDFYISTTDFLVELLEKEASLKTFLELSSKYAGKMHSSILERAAEYFRRRFAQEFATKLTNDNVSLKEILALVLSEAGGGVSLVDSSIVARTFNLMFSQDHSNREGEIRELERTLCKQLFNRVDIQDEASGSQAPPSQFFSPSAVKTESEPNEKKEGEPPQARCGIL